jgi:hypothetical protein
MIAARLWDVDPASNTETLVARGVCRLDPSSPDGVQVFQLHPGAWHFAAGHIPKLELLGQDSPYVRTSNGQFSISVSDLQLRLPVHEVPGAPGTPAAVVKPLPHFAGVACGVRPASRLDKRAVRIGRNGFSLSGTASERRCPGAVTSATVQDNRVSRVYVSVYRNLPGGRCRFLLSSGRLSAARSCGRPIEFRATGTTPVEAASPAPGARGQLSDPRRRGRRVRPSPAPQRRLGQGSARALISVA